MKVTENAPFFEAQRQAKQAIEPPPLIVLCTWMGASSPHIAKYVEGYQSICKYSIVLVVETSVWDVTSGSQDAQRKSLMPVVDMMQGATGAVIMHAFSNAGAYTLTQIMSALRERCEAVKVPIATILDSCPGTWTHLRIARAAAAGTPRKYGLRIAVLGGMYTGSILYRALLWIMGIENSVSSTRRLLNDARLIPLAEPRLYLVSKADEIIDLKAVEDHLRDSHMAGYKNVQISIFSTASHCALVNEDRVRYWKHIQCLLKENSIDCEPLRSLL